MEGDRSDRSTEGPLAGRMIFLVGARRSGTNWLQRILEAHPSVAGIPSETYLFSHGIAPLAERFQHASPGSSRTGFVHLDRRELIDALRDLCDRVFLAARQATDPDAERLVERTPWHARHLELIGEVYPDAHVIHILRDGRDVARSLLSQDWGPDTIEDAAGEWRDTIEDARREGPDERYLEVRYEDVLADPREEIGKLVAGLGLDASDAIFDRMVEAAGVRFNVDTASPEVAAGKWRAELDDGQVQAFYSVAGDLLRELGYDTTEPTTDSTPAPPATRRVLGRFRPSWGRYRPSWLGGTAERHLTKRVGRENLRQVEAAQEVVDRFLGRLHTGDVEGACSLLGDGVTVTVAGPGGRWSEAGVRGRERLSEVLREDRALAGTQIGGQVYPSIPTFFVMSDYRLSDGSVERRAMALTVGRGAITALDRYEL